MVGSPTGDRRTANGRLSRRPGSRTMTSGVSSGYAVLTSTSVRDVTFRFGRTSVAAPHSQPDSRLGSPDRWRGAWQRRRRVGHRWQHRIVGRGARTGGGARGSGSVGSDIGGSTAESAGEPGLVAGRVAAASSGRTSVAAPHSRPDSRPGSPDRWRGAWQRRRRVGHRWQHRRVGRGARTGGGGAWQRLRGAGHRWQHRRVDGSGGPAQAGVRRFDPAAAGSVP